MDRFWDQFAKSLTTEWCNMTSLSLPYIKTAHLSPNVFEYFRNSKLKCLRIELVPTPGQTYQLYDYITSIINLLPSSRLIELELTWLVKEEVWRSFCDALGKTDRHLNQILIHYVELTLENIEYFVEKILMRQYSMKRFHVRFSTLRDLESSIKLLEKLCIYPRKIDEIQINNFFL
jgi:hypothetical protein